MASPEQTVAVAVIGVTRSGKSTFINVASGSNLPVRESVRSSTTSELQSSSFSLDGRTVILIDTPGFDDEHPGVLGVLKLISDHSAGLQGVKLAGVIYMDCVAEDRMRGPSWHNFQIFGKFCGCTGLRDVVVVTDTQSATNDEVFGPAIDKGVRIFCHDGSRASAHAILRHLLDRERTVCPSPGELLGQKTDPNGPTTGVDIIRELTGRVEQHTKAIGELCQRIDAATLVEDKNATKTLHEEANNSLEKIESLRYDLEHLVTNIATENSQLEGENRRYKNDFAEQRAEAELRIRLLGEERKARELAEAERQRAEAHLADERAFWERQRSEMESLSGREHAGAKYDKVFACGALIVILLCVSRFALLL